MSVFHPSLGAGSHFSGEKVLNGDREEEEEEGLVEYESKQLDSPAAKTS